MTARINQPLLSNTNLAILDGGLGTTLETTFGLDISHTPLWSAKAAIEHPETIVDAHLAFLRAGAQIILTSTYQCSLETFHKAGYTDDDAQSLIVKCVELAVEARRRFRTERPQESSKIALSLGPYGAGLSPAQEFDGYYPPPFGPRGYTQDGQNINAYPPENAHDEELAIQSLADYHLSRLRIVGDNAAAWNALDFIAFETIPLLREVCAVRIAMGRFFETTTPKPWWISFVFPDGKFPQTVHPDTNERVSVQELVTAALGRPSLERPCPSAIGINCTQVEVLPEIIREMEAALRDDSDSEPQRPWLVLYPNAGDVYNPVSQTWIVKAGARDVWVDQLRIIVEELNVGSVWAGVVVGGCCRTGPEDIKLLSGIRSQS
ncbi:Homocysteine S-methyltransferase [Mycena amicta]|nr:Homocysteine S-methyltransferase [Mycena amicta]